MVAEPLALLVAGIVLLIDDEQAEPVQRGKNRRAHTDDHVDITRATARQAS